MHVLRFHSLPLESVDIQIFSAVKTSPAHGHGHIHKVYLQQKCLFHRNNVIYKNKSVFTKFTGSFNSSFFVPPGFSKSSL